MFLHQIIPELFDSSYYSVQPSSSQNDEWLVYAKAANNIWSETDLFIASKTGVINSVSENMKLHAVFIQSCKYVLNFKFKINSINTICNIYSIDGKLCISESINAANQAVIDVSELNSGLYFYSLNSGNEVYQDKLIIQK
ncbi:MAG: T9SS type A sorting domain-containing protein [Bacteroidetes bacterium]|nr:T9SS type A sorting domain-containing protein [Bacteroidota bacterium]